MKKNIRPLLWVVSVAILLTMSLAGGARCFALDPTENFYVCDNADVISETTEKYIISKNEALFALTGSQIVVCTVDSTDAESIDDYSYEIFNDWGIGSSERNNGVLLLLAIDDDNYYMLQGYGIEEYLTSGKMKLIMNESLEADFDAGNYDSGVRATFDSLISFMEELYQTDIDTWDGTTQNFTVGETYVDKYGSYYYGYEDDNFTQTHSSSAESSGIYTFFAIIVVFIILVIALVIISTISSFARRSNALPWIFLFGSGRRHHPPHRPPHDHGSRPRSFWDDNDHHRGGRGGGGFGGGFGGGGGHSGGFGGGGGHSSGFGGGGGGSHGGGAGRG